MGLLRIPSHDEEDNENGAITILEATGGVSLKQRDYSEGINPKGDYRYTVIFTALSTIQEYEHQSTHRLKYQ